MPCSSTRESCDEDLADWGGITTWLDQVPLHTREGRAPNKHIYKDTCREATMGSEADGPSYTSCFSPVCRHASCATLKQRGLCQHWFFLRWVSSAFTTPKDLLQLVHQQVGDRPFRLCSVVTREGVYEAIVSFDKGQFPDCARKLLPPAVMRNFNAGLSRSWTLDCCLNTLLPEAEFWHYRLQDRPGEFIFGDKDLPRDFLAEVKAALRAAHEPALVPLAAN